MDSSHEMMRPPAAPQNHVAPALGENQSPNVDDVDRGGNSFDSWRERARRATDDEKKMGVREAVKLYPMAVLFSVGSVSLLLV